MENQTSISQLIKNRIIKSLTWYLYSLVYFAFVGLVDAYAWYQNPIAHRAGSWFAVGVRFELTGWRDKQGFGSHSGMVLIEES